MTTKKLLAIEKYGALALALINLVLLIVGIIYKVNVVGPVLGFLVMTVLFIIVCLYGKKLEKMDREYREQQEKEHQEQKTEEKE